MPNESNAPTKDNWLNGHKTRLIYILSTRRSTYRSESTYRLKWGDRKGSPYKWKSEEPGVVILISDKIDIQTNLWQETKKDPTWWSRDPSEDKTTVNIYAPNIGKPQLSARKILTEEQQYLQ